MYQKELYFVRAKYGLKYERRINNERNQVHDIFKYSVDALTSGRKGI